EEESRAVGVSEPWTYRGTARALGGEDSVGNAVGRQFVLQCDELPGPAIAEDPAERGRAREDHRGREPDPIRGRADAVRIAEALEGGIAVEARRGIPLQDDGGQSASRAAEDAVRHGDLAGSRGAGEDDVPAVIRGDAELLEHRSRRRGTTDLREQRDGAAVQVGEVDAAAFRLSQDVEGCEEGDLSPCDRGALEFGEGHGERVGVSRCNLPTRATARLPSTWYGAS